MWVTLGAVGSFTAAGAILMVLVSGEIQDINRTIDDIMVSDRQQEILEDIPTVSSCDTLRSYVAFSQEIVAGDGATDEGFYGTPYGERLGEAAEAQLDRLRCGR